MSDHEEDHREVGTKSRYSFEIKSRHGFLALDLRELWRYRHLLQLFVWRDVKVRYKQTALGIVWLILQPIAMAIIYSIFFGRLARMPSEGVPYPIYVLTGIVIWQFFSRAVSDGTTSLANQTALLSKIYFPRLIAPMTAVAAAAFDFAIMFSVLILAMPFFGMLPQATIILVPIPLCGLGLLALGISLILTGADAVFRDVRYALGFGLQIWYFLSPIVYPLEIVPEAFRTLYLLNPAAPLVQLFRWCMLPGVIAPPLWSLCASAVVIAMLIAAGLAIFQTVERNIVDQL